MRLHCPIKLARKVGPKAEVVCEYKTKASLEHYWRENDPPAGRRWTAVRDPAAARPYYIVETVR